MKSIIQSMVESDVGYAGVNFPIDECLSCGSSGIFCGDCPSCESSEIRRIRRITGYLSTVDRFNHGKKAELENRVVHGT
jgi:ribonucleoside-triphosphate reductase